MALGAAAVPLLTTVVSSLLGHLLGGKKKNTYLPGFPGAQDFQQLILQLLSGQGGQVGGPLGALGQLAGGQGGALGAIQNRQPVSDLQRLAYGGSFSQYLGQPAPEQRALEIALPALQRQLSGTGSEGVLAPLTASYQQNLSDLLARSDTNAPNRFSSGLDTQNTLLKQRSLTDFNTLAAQILEQGQQRQLQAAQTLGGLSSQAGQNPFSRLLGAGQLGTQQAGLQQSGQLDALRLLLGPVLTSAFGGAWQTQPSGLVQGAQLGGGLAQLLLLSQLLSRGGGVKGGVGAQGDFPFSSLGAFG